MSRYVIVIYYGNFWNNGLTIIALNKQWLKKTYNAKADHIVTHLKNLEKHKETNLLLKYTMSIAVVPNLFGIVEFSLQRGKPEFFLFVLL